MVYGSLPIIPSAVIVNIGYESEILIDFDKDVLSNMLLVYDITFGFRGSGRKKTN